MRAIILAAGRGSRLKQLTNERPKCMVPLHGKPLILHQAEALHQGGVSEIAIVTGYLQDKIISIGEKQRFFNEDWQSSNMVWSLMKADAWLTEAPCIVSYSDIFYHPDAITSLVSALGDIAITYDSYYLENWSKRFSNPLDDLESFKFSNGRLSEIGKKPTSLNDVQGQYMGLLKFTPLGWSKIKALLRSLPGEVVKKCDMTSLLNLALQNHLSISTVCYDQPWGEIDHQSDLALYEGLA
jgi:choline kinase